MKITEVISQLEDIAEQHGDIEVVCEHPGLGMELVSPLPIRVLEPGCEGIGHVALITPVTPR
jgi:hypothetical protein